MSSLGWSSVEARVRPRDSDRVIIMVLGASSESRDPEDDTDMLCAGIVPRTPPTQSRYSALLISSRAMDWMSRPRSM
jgi:hypothetical protein